MKKTVVFINESHILTAEQEVIIRNKFFPGDVEPYLTPDTGLSHDEMRDIVKKYENYNMVFVSPVPAMLMWASKNGASVYVFSNEKRIKKELPNGKIITTVAPTGWELLS